MKCLMRYQWVKLLRLHLPEGKGVMGAWAKLASRAAFRKGQASYCGHINAVRPGMWAGGITGLKSILGVRSRTLALESLQKLSQLGYIEYELDPKTKKLTYQISDWVVKCSGAECMDGAVYATDGHGFLCLPRSIPDRLAEQNYIFEEADAWLDLWCHTVFEDSGNAFSYLAPTIQYGKYGRIDFGITGTTLELGKDKGLSVFQEAWGCFQTGSFERFLRLSRVQYIVPHRYRIYNAHTGANRAHYCRSAFSRSECV